MIEKQSILGICSSSKNTTSIQQPDGSIFIKSILKVLESNEIQDSIRHGTYITIYEFFEKVRESTFNLGQEIEVTQIPIIGSLKQGNEGSYLFP